MSRNTAATLSEDYVPRQEPVRLLDFDAPRAVTSATAVGFAVSEFDFRHAPQGRVRPDLTSLERRAGLLAQFRELAALSLNVPLTRAQRCRLALVRWELDRIHEAELGPALDFWEQVAEQHEALARDVKQFVDRLARRGAGVRGQASEGVALLRVGPREWGGRAAEVPRGAGYFSIK